jgi:ABC-2 type transport system permease protein
VSVLRDALIVFGYQMRILLRAPVWFFIGLVQPLLYLALFGPLLRPLTRVRGFPPGDEWQVFVPGLLIQLGIFGSMFVGFGLIAEIRYGVVERMRVTPASRLALLLGRVMRDTLQLLVQATILTLVAVFFGLRVGATGALFTVLLVILLGMALSSMSYAAALWLKHEDSLAPLLNSVALPILLLSGILLPMSLAPAWLFGVSRISPFVYVVEAARAAFRGDLHGAVVLAGLVAATALAASGLALATHLFHRESA